jgi:gamma-glutamyltranspeptidase / glutathione hydrolase
MRTMGREGMVASPHYLATASGLNVLRQGGNAVDAAIAVNAVLAVVTPYQCGLGGDLFALVYQSNGGTITGINASGRAPAAANLATMQEMVRSDRMPERGPLTITVPGCLDAWGKLHERFGTLPFHRLLADAIGYAERGFPASANCTKQIRDFTPFLHPQTLAGETFLPGGSVPKEGELILQPRLARTLRRVAEDGPSVFYRGDVAEEIARSVQRVAGLLTVEDLAEHRSDWVAPLCLRYRDVTVYQMPPNSQGVIALLMLNILQYLPEAPLRRGGEEYIHLLAEVARIAYADRERFLTDPDHMTIRLSEHLEPAYGRSHAMAIGERATRGVAQAEPGDTAYMCTADSAGNLVSLIQSNYRGIGSGVMAGETGVMLQNRGSWFSLDPGHPNVIAPRKRTAHTLMPAMASRNDTPWLVFGTMGGSMQPQIQVQLLTRLIDQGMAVDEAVAAPRFDAVVDTTSKEAGLHIEARFPPRILLGLRRRGHVITKVDPFSPEMGYAHMIQIRDNGVYVGATDPRTESLALGY